MVKAPQNSASRARGSRTANSKSTSAKSATGKAGAAKTAPSKANVTKSTTAKPASASKTSGTASKSTPVKAAAAKTQLTQKPQTIDLPPKEVSAGKVASGEPKPTEPNQTGSLPAGDAVKVLEEARSRATRSSDNGSSSAKSPPPKKGFGILAIILAGATGGALTILAGLAVMGSGVLRTDIGPMQHQLEELQSQLQGVSSQMQGVSGQVQTLQSADPIQLPPDLSQPLDELASTVTRLDTRLNEVDATSVQRSEQSEGKLTEIDLDLVELSGDIKAQISAMEVIFDEKLADVSQRHEALAARHNALEASVTSGQAGDGPALAAIEAKLQELATAQAQLSTQVSSSTSTPNSASSSNNATQFDGLLTAFKQAVIKAERVNDALIEQGKKLAVLSVRTDTLETSLLEQQQTTPANSAPAIGPTFDRGVGINYLHDSLIIALQRGVPFTALLQNIETQLPEAYPYAQLAASAQNGILPLESLADEIGKLHRDISAKLLAAQSELNTPLAENETSGSLWDRMLDNMGSLVTVRELDQTAQQQLSPLLQPLRTAEELVRQGRVSDAIIQLEDMSRQEALTGLSGSDDGLKLGGALVQWTDTLTQHSEANTLLAALSKARDATWAQGAKP